MLFIRTNRFGIFPAWKYPKPIGPNEEHKRNVEEQHKEKVEEYMNENNLKKEDMWIKVREGYHKLKHHGEILIKIAPEYKFNEVDQYKTAKENANELAIQD